ncbi:GtrA family protein [Amycolatopsis oliviviridis]|uniref:Sugar translocase n=1 Tax=Amycolatopsis oliviviridis TaxID=1471590 RepID=A0ABQ3LTI2_9PSEU|nr:GtrA family protein [Amycolatopsis oliviviridis]GHH25741.1 sugar translocase [Amycolatopsis oliviviridis]
MLGRHRELLRFAVVGGASFVITMTINYGLKFTVLTDKPVTALMIGVLVATVFSYVANREWSFRFRGGRERTHEAALFFLLSAIALGLNALPQLISRHVLDLEQPHVGLLTQEIADFVSGVVIGTLLGTVFRWWSFKKWVFPVADARPRLVRGEGRRADDIPEDPAA